MENFIIQNPIISVLISGVVGSFCALFILSICVSGREADVQTKYLFKIKEKDDEIKSLNIIIAEYIEKVDALITEKGEYCRDFLKYKKLYDQTYLQLDTLRASLVREKNSVGYKMTPTEKVKSK